jgi:alanyl-tRNA synthetase
MNTQELSPQFLAQKTWDLYQTHGVPIEVSEDILQNQGLNLDFKLLNELINQHQKLSQTTSAGQFKSGLGSDSYKAKKLHTTTHILHSVLREIFGKEVKQMGSSITDNKARFDFSLDKKIETQDLENIAKKVQEIINLNLQMQAKEMTPIEAQNLGAIGLFGEKYGQIVTVYTLENEKGQVYSREFCGGPHINNTSEIGKFVILKQKSIGQNLRRLEFDVV